MDDQSVDELLALDDKYDQLAATICASKNKDIVDEYLGKTKDTSEGFNQVKTWSLKKKLAPKNVIDTPAAKLNEEGKLVTDKSELDELYLKTYSSITLLPAIGSGISCGFILQ